MGRPFRLQHVNVLVDDLAAATRFYRDVLGLEPIPTPDLGYPAQFFRFNDEQEVHVNQLPDTKPARAHFCVVVEEFEAVFRRMKAAGAIDVEARGRIRRLPAGTMQMFVRDPSGNLVEIASPPGAAIDPALLEDPLVDPEVGYFRPLEPTPGGGGSPRRA
jgi:catechol 2,3-dioxygenase-like lactoylglutathione lyase family enzyme